MTKVYVVRHAEAEGNLYGRPHAWYDSNLTSLGKRQIKALGRRLKDVEFDGFYSSDLKRARDTAGAVMEGRPGAKLVVTERLRELHLGIWEDTTWGYLNRFHHEMLLKYRSDMTFWKVEGSEYFTDVMERMVGIVKEAAAAHRGKNVLLASHGFAIRALLTAVRGLTPADIKQVPFCGNTAVSIFNVDDDGKITLELENDASHLDVPDEFGTLHRKPVDNVNSYIRFESFDLGKYGELYKKWNPDGDVEKAARLLKKEPGALWLMYHNEEPMGMLELDTDRDRDLGKGVISWYYIIPEKRGLAISKPLIGQAISVYRNLARDYLKIEVPADDLDVNKYFLYYNFKQTGETVKNGKTYNVLEYSLLVV